MRFKSIILVLCVLFLFSLMICANVMAKEKGEKGDGSSLIPPPILKLQGLTDKQKAELEKIFGQSAEGKKYAAIKEKIKGMEDKESEEAQQAKDESKTLMKSLMEQANKVLTPKQQEELKAAKTKGGKDGKSGKGGKGKKGGKKSADEGNE